MNYVMILAGGTGTRIGGDIPKQFISVKNRPIISYGLEQFQNSDLVNSIVIVVSEEWKDRLETIVKEERFSKIIGFATSGKTRQHSIINGLCFLDKYGAKEDDNIVIHDSVRPCITKRLIEQCFKLLDDFDGVMPVLPAKDTIYLSDDGKYVSNLTNRDRMYIGQAPEGFKFGKYYKANISMSEEELLHIKGSSEVAFINKIDVRLFWGDESNYKITTIDDLVRFEKQILGNEGE